MKTKILPWSVVSILIVGILAAAVWWLRRPQTIILDDGAKLTLVAVTYGKHHVFPGAKNPNRARPAAFEGTNDFLVIWIRQEHMPDAWPQYQLYAYDKAGTACVGNSGITYSGRQPGGEVVGILFNAFPRREEKIFLRVQERNRQDGRQTVRNAFVISNPAHGPFPAWFSDSLPSTQSDGDLDVTLNKLVFGAKAPWERDSTAPDDAMNKAVQVSFDVQQNGHTATNWQPVQIKTSDATGNHVPGWCNTQNQDGEPETLYQWGLWADEPAWKVRVEFSRTSGFTDDELWTVQNIPVETGKMRDYWNYNGRNHSGVPFAGTTLNGIPLNIFPVSRFTDQPPGSQPQGTVQIQTGRPLDGMRMTLLKATDDQGRDIQNWNWNSTGNYYSFAFRELGDTKTVSLTIAVHKSRFVEFTAKPAKQ